MVAHNPISDIKIEQNNGKSDQERVVSCNHTTTQGRNGEKGSWCVDCGIKVYEVETRECKDCKYFFKRPFFTGCESKLMAVVPSMNVTYKLSEGTCFKDS